MRFLLIDTMSVFYRAYFSSRPSYNSHNEPISALNRFLHLIDNINRDYPGDEIIFCEDAPRSTLYRQKLYTEYKSGRKKPADEFIQQKGMLFGFLRKIGFPVVGVSGYEADDIIGTLAKTLSREGNDVLIVSSDKDMFQLMINDRIGVIRHNPNTKTDVLLYRDDIYSEYGYWPEQVVDLKILSGDSSDNIPGIPKCGFKIARDLLKKYRDIPGIIDAKDLEGKSREFQKYLIKSPKNINMFRDIITIQCDIDPDDISKQLAYRVTEKTMDETLKRYEVISPDDFIALSYSGYLYNRLEKEEI